MLGRYSKTIFPTLSGLIILTLISQVIAQQPTASRFSSKLPPIPQKLSKKIPSQPVGLWGSTGELKRLPPTENRTQNSDSAVAQKNNAIKKVVATQLSKDSAPTVAQSRFSAPLSQQAVRDSASTVPAKPINWNQPTVIAGASSKNWNRSLTQQTSYQPRKPESNSGTEKPINKTIEKTITPGHALPAGTGSRFSQFSSPVSTQVATAAPKTSAPKTSLLPPMKEEKVVSPTAPQITKSRFSSNQPMAPKFASIPASVDNKPAYAAGIDKPANIKSPEPVATARSVTTPNPESRFSAKLPAQEVKREVAPVTHLENGPTASKKSAAVFARISDLQEEVQVHTVRREDLAKPVKRTDGKSPIYVCRMLGLQAVEK